MSFFSGLVTNGKTNFEVTSAAVARSGASGNLQAPDLATILPLAGDRGAHGAGRCADGGRSDAEGAAPAGGEAHFMGTDKIQY